MENGPTLKVTVQMIADRVGVSKGTVDRALHNREGINEETKEKILEVAAELNYKPNRAARSLALKKHKRVGVIIRSEPAFFWNAVKHGITNAYQELQDYGIEILMSELDHLRVDPDELILQINQMMSKNIDALIIVPTNTPTIQEKLSEIAKNGVAVVTLNDDIEFDGRLLYIGPHIQQGGRVGAQLMGILLQGKGKIITINNSYLSSYSYQKRMSSFMDTMNSLYPDIRIVANYDYDYDQSEQYNASIIKTIIENTTDLRGIYNVDGGSLYETGSIVRNMGVEDLILVGYESWSKVTELIRDGIIDAVINQDPYMQGYHAVRMVYRYIVEGEKLSYNEYFTRTDILLKENLPEGANVINSTDYVI
jgi:LacI family transcriptional regulator